MRLKRGNTNQRKNIIVYKVSIETNKYNAPSIKGLNLTFNSDFNNTHAHKCVFRQDSNFLDLFVLNWLIFPFYLVSRLHPKCKHNVQSLNASQIRLNRYTILAFTPSPNFTSILINYYCTWLITIVRILLISNYDNTSKSISCLQVFINY